MGLKKQQTQKNTPPVTNNEMAVYSPEMYEEVLVYFRTNHYKS